MRPWRWRQCTCGLSSLPQELRFRAVRANSGSLGGTPPAHLRFRIEGGRFARYPWLIDGINFHNGVTDGEFDNEPGVDVDAGPRFDRQASDSRRRRPAVTPAEVSLPR